AAGVAADIEFVAADVADVTALTRRWPRGAVCTNPPYGERLAEHDLAALYRRMAAALSRVDWPVVILSGNPLLAREMRAKPRISHRLFNGPLEVRLLRYEPPARDRL